MSQTRVMNLLAKAKKLVKMKTKSFYAEHKIFLYVWVIYAIALTITYRMISITYETNWLYFFRYLFQNGALPYVDCREGYPPLGFLIYMPLAYLASHNSLIFFYGMRTINATFLLLSLLLTYIIIYRVRGKRDALLGLIVFVALPSTPLLSRFSNDIIALFFSLLAIYFMLAGKSTLTGIAVGLASMTKVFPVLLLIPALKWFKGNERRLQLVGATFVTVYFISLPFLIADPFMYASTFIHHETRGPWETIWALMDGWYGHGGFLRPDFDQFLYHHQLLKIYPLLPNDHAFYAWRYPSLPTLLLICEFAVIMASFLLMHKCSDKEVLLKGVGLAFLGYILFFKGYSPQFTVFLLPLVLISLDGLWKVCLSIPLELGTILQMIAWTYEIWFSHDYHLPVLVSGIVIRTAALIAAVGLLSAQLWKLRKGEVKLS